MAKTEPKSKAQIAIEARDAARRKLYALNGEYDAIERRISDLHAQGAAKDRRSAAERYLDGNDPEKLDRQKSIDEAQEHLRLVGDARRIQRQRVLEAEHAAAKAASEEVLPEHRRAVGEAVLAVIAALVAVERAKAIETKLDDECLLSSSVIAPAAFARLGRLDDSSAPWAWWVKSLVPYAGVTPGAMREAFAEFWPRAKAALQIEDAPALSAAKKLMAAVLPT